MTLLTDALPLLELESPVTMDITLLVCTLHFPHQVFNTEQTYALAHFLRQLSPIASQPLDYTAEQDTSSQVTVYVKLNKGFIRVFSILQDGNNNKVSLLWLALVRNLSRAMLEAPSL